MKEANAVIVNLTGQTWTLYRSYGTFTVRGCDGAEPGRCLDGDAQGDAYTVTRVMPRTALMDLGDKRTIDVPITAREIAEDLCHEINADGGDDSYFGVFVAAGESPTQDEIAQSKVRLAAFYRRLVAAADREWERSHSYLFINDVERRAAQYLGVEKEWFYQPRETVECPGCGEKIKPGFAVCKTCGAILDRAKAATLGLVPPAAAPAGVAHAVHAEAAKPAHTAAPARR